MYMYKNMRARSRPWVMKIVQFICSVLSDRLSYPSLTPGACSNSHPSSRWCHLIVLFNIVPFSSCLRSFRTAEKTSGKTPCRVLWESYWSKVQQKNLLENPIQSYGSLPDQRSNLWSQMIIHTEKLLTEEVLEKLPEVAHFSRSISSHKNVALFISQDLKKLWVTGLF